MDYQKAIELLHPDTSRDAIWKIADEEEAINKIKEALLMACEAMKEIQEYKDGKFCLVPGDVYARQCEELDAYKQLGDLEEVREAVEKQRAKKPTFDGDGYAPDGTFVWDKWICPNCGERYEVEFEEHAYCPDCGQAIDWSEEE